MAVGFAEMYSWTSSMKKLLEHKRSSFDMRLPDAAACNKAPELNRGRQGTVKAFGARGWRRGVAIGKPAAYHDGEAAPGTGSRASTSSSTLSP